MDKRHKTIVAIAAIIMAVTFIVASYFWSTIGIWGEERPPEAYTPIILMGHERISNGTYSFKIEAIWLQLASRNDVNWSNIQILVDPGIGISTYKPATKLIEVNDTITISGMIPGTKYQITLKYLRTDLVCGRTLLNAI